MHLGRRADEIHPLIRHNSIFPSEPAIRANKAENRMVQFNFLCECWSAVTDYYVTVSGHPAFRAYQAVADHYWLPGR